MHVLVCEDDPAARFVIKRWLSSTLGCTVTDCEDGVQALDLLSSRPFDLAVLDLDLPRLHGVEVVEAIRGSDDVRDLPIVILSHERSQDVVRRLVELGVSDYLIKPLRAQTVRDRIGPLLARRRGRSAATAQANARLCAETPALIVDGDANFRHVFTSVASQFGAVIPAESGAEALALYRRTPVDLVFIGEQLGIMAADVLIRKIREADTQGTVFVKVGAREAGGAADAYLATIPRPFVPDALAAALKPFVFVAGPLTAFGEMAPHIETCLGSSVVQVFGMMTGLDAHESPDGPDTVAPSVVSSVTLTANSAFLLDIDLVLPTPIARAVTATMFGCGEDEVDEDGIFSTTGELTNMVGGRLDAWLKAQSLTSVFTLPATRHLPAGESLPPIEAGAGLVRAFAIDGHPEPLVLRVGVRRPD
ncbi:MAG: response regulator [Acidobacteria bacterium]|nr:response regulator [Acidobacteriota bacterium]